jgi:hypothetical protein
MHSNIHTHTHTHIHIHTDTHTYTQIHIGEAIGVSIYLNSHNMLQAT